MIDARRAIARAMSEDELLDVITEAATFLGWRWHHVRRSDRAVQQGHSGFPDLVLARRGRVLFVELKREVGELTGDQVAWIEAIGDQAMVARPVDLDLILSMLKAPA